MGGDLVEVGGAGGADRVALGDEAAADVDGGLAVAPRRAGVDEGARPTRLAQPEVVVVDELGRGEAVVELDQVEVLGTDARLFVGLVGGQARERVDVGLHLSGVDPRVRRHHRSRDLDGPLADVGVERLQLGVGHEHDGCRPVTGRAAHQQGVRVRLHR